MTYSYKYWVLVYIYSLSLHDLKFLQPDMIKRLTFVLSHDGLNDAQG
jgi:hypothetical protein